MVATYIVRVVGSFAISGRGVQAGSYPPLSGNLLV